MDKSARSGGAIHGIKRQLAAWRKQMAPTAPRSKRISERSSPLKKFREEVSGTSPGQAKGMRAPATSCTAAGTTSWLSGRSSRRRRKGCSNTSQRPPRILEHFPEASLNPLRPPRPQVLPQKRKEITTKTTATTIRSNVDSRGYVLFLFFNTLVSYFDFS